MISSACDPAIFIPEDRLGMGLVGSMDIVHNLILKDYQNQPRFCAGDRIKKRIKS